MTVYFSFPDGLFSYRCATCDQRCCAGGLLVDRRRDLALLERARDLRLFLRPGSARGHFVVLDTPHARCWFLGGDGRCNIEADLSYSAKPAMCRLFPVNLAFSLSRHPAVLLGLNLFCPVEAGGTAERSTLLHHGAIEAELRPLLESAAFVPAPAPSHMESYPLGFLGLEEHARDLAAAFAGGDAADLAGRQLVAAWFFGAGLAPASPPSDEQIAWGRDEVRAHVRRVAGLLACAGGEVDPPARLVRALGALTGLFRLDLLMRLRGDDYVEAALRIPLILGTLAWFAGREARTVEGLGGRRADDLHALNHLFRRIGELLVILTHLDDVPVLERDLSPDPALEPLRPWDASSTATLAQRLLEIDPAERLSLAGTLAAHRHAVRFLPTD